MKVTELKTILNLADQLGVEEIQIVQPGRDGAKPYYKDFKVTGVATNLPGQGLESMLVIAVQY